MTPELAKAALVFLSRADMKGAEVDAFMQICRALHELANPEPAAPVVQNEDAH